MSLFLQTSIILTVVGSAVIGGIFFAFSSFIMGALAKLPAANGIAAMQSINIVVINKSFLIVFFGTALLSLMVGITAITNWSSTSPYLIAGAVLYLVGTFLVTVVGNVPLNNKLAAISPFDASATELWQHYLGTWTFFNSVRAATGIVAAVMMISGLIKLQG